jgi:hypothetical protein
VSLTPRTRFLVLNRDGFTCRYCGAKAPNVELQVDHIVTSRGGSDDMENLITACQPCNAGKGDLVLDDLQGFCMANHDDAGPPHRLNGYTGCPCGEPVYRVVRGEELCRRHFIRQTKTLPTLATRYPGRDPEELWFEMQHHWPRWNAFLARENALIAELDA